jgi:hypothetical protein
MQAGYLFEEEYRSNNNADRDLLRKAEQHYLEAYNLIKKNEKHLLIQLI